MSPDKLNEIIDKYESGTSTLEEEQYLFEQAKNSDNAIGSWAAFVHHNKRETSDNLNEELWASFEERTVNKKRYLYWLMAAASIILVFGIFIHKSAENKQSYAEKKALLEEARSMLSPSPKKVKIKNEIIYEDDILIIYNKIETPIN